MIGQTVILRTNRETAHRMVAAAPMGAVLNIKPATRSNQQNALLWSLLSEVSRAKPDGRTHTPDVWKALFMSACGHAVQFEIGLDDRPFPLGFRSSRLSKDQMTDLIEFIFQYCAEKGVPVQQDQAASADTRPQGGDALAAPFTSGAVPKADAQNTVQTSVPSISGRVN